MSSRFLFIHTRVENELQSCCIVKRNHFVFIMKVNLFIVLTVSLISLINQSCGQVNNHYLTVEQFIPPLVGASTFRCNCGMVSPRHVVATANCVTVVAPFQIGVRHFITIAGVTSDTFSSTERIAIHPEYLRTQAIEFNIAVIMVSSHLGMSQCL